MTKDAKPKAIDLFCGCGGISAGLELADFKVIAGIDIEKKYLGSFIHNFPDALGLDWDLSKIPPAKFMKTVGIQQGELDLLVGGPPCQGFSKNVPRKNRYLESPNNLLIKTYLDYCEAIQPKMLLMENVAEMKNGFEQKYTEEIRERLEESGYTVTEVVLNAADFGVPQRRRRAFFLANRFGIEFISPKPTHAAVKSQTDQKVSQLALISKPNHVTVWEAISDLPSLNHGEGSSSCDYICGPLSDYQKIIRSNSSKIRNHVARQLQQTQYDRLASLEPGQGHKDLPKHLQVKSGYSGAYGRLTKEMIAPTITRWVFHPGSGRWGHPVDTRVITIREAARIQGFPDTFEFVGSYTQQAGQIGNAVPPLMAKHIIQSMCNQLDKFKPDSISIKLSKDNFSDSAGKAKLIV